MILLVAAVLCLASVLALALLPVPRRGEGGRLPWLRGALVALLCLLPLVYAGVVLWRAEERLGELRFDYVGKRLAFGPGLPVTFGGSPAGSESFEDLHAALLGGEAGALVQEDGTAGVGGRRLLRLAAPSPMVLVDGLPLNAVPLVKGDRLALEDGRELLFDGASLRPAGGASDAGVSAAGASDAVFRLPSLLRRLASPERVVFLPDVLRAFDEQRPEGGPPWSFLFHDDKGWNLLLRDAEVRVLPAEGGEPRVFQRDHPVGTDFDLELRVVWGGEGRRGLRTARRDHLRLEEDAVEVRFTRRQRFAVDPPRGRTALELAVVVPSSFEEQPMIELADASRRFQGLSALFTWTPGSGAAAPPLLTYLGDRQEVAFGGLYGLGEGDDRLLIRIDRESFPWVLLLDLALLGLYLAVFLGRALYAGGGMAALAGPAGLLLANRLLFAYKAASRPPFFATSVLAEARLALWLLPALLLAAHSLAWLLRRHRPSGDLAPLRWSLAGLGLAALGCLVNGDAGDRALAAVPLLAAVLLAAAVRLAARPAVARRLDALRADGVPWRAWWWLPVVGVAIFLVRAFAARVVGMPETLRLPGDLRLLWTVLQLPLAAAVFALALHRARARLAASPGNGPTGDRAAAFALLEVVGLLAFVALAFAGVAWAAADGGLLLAQALPYAVALLLLADRPAAAGATWRGRLAAAAALLLLVLPLAGVAWANVFPEQLMAAKSRADGVVAALRGGGEEGTAAGDEEVADLGTGADASAVAGDLDTLRSQQMFRLYMLANPSALRDIGVVPSERVAIHYHTLQDYAGSGGLTGTGYLASPIPRHLGDTYLSDLVPMVFVLPELGKLGLLGLALLYLTPLAWLAAAVARWRSAASPLAEQGLWLAAVALLAVAVPSLYMILANLNLVMFTGKNCALLALNSLSDVLESGALLSLATLGLGLRRTLP